MDSGAEAANVASEVRDFVTSKLRNTYPYLKTGTMERMVDTLSRELESELLAQEPIMAASKANAGLLKIPAELRNQIYELILTPEEGVLVETQAHEKWTVYSDSVTGERYSSRNGWDVRPAATPALLRLNRQIRSEALPIYYKVNTFAASFGRRFDIGFARAASSWLKLLGPENAACIENFVVRFRKQEIKDVACTTDFIKAGFTSMCIHAHDDFRSCIFRHSPARKYQIIQALELVENGVSLDKIKVVYYKLNLLSVGPDFKEMELED